MNQEANDPVQALLEESVAWVHAGQTGKALLALFRLFNLDPGHSEALLAASRLMSLARDMKGAELMGKLARDPDDPNLLYETGFHLSDAGRPDAARPFLEACLHQVGDHAGVLYELGYCNFLDQKYERAANMLKKASAGLDIEHSAAAELLMVECLMYAHRSEEAMAALKKGEDEYRAWGRGDSVEALGLLHRRYGRIEEEPPWDLRTWHFVQHGGVLLAQSDQRNNKGHFQSLAMNVLAVGAVLRLFQAVVEGLALKLDAILYVEADSLTLALALGSLLERPVRAWDQRTGESELLVVPDLNFLATRKINPVSRDDCEQIFCFQASPFKEYAILPEFLGLLAHSFRFPWQERVEFIPDGQDGPKAHDVPPDTRDPEILGRELAEAARMLPADTKAPGLVSFYKQRRNLLVCSNRESFPSRRVFNPQTPA